MPDIYKMKGLLLLCNIPLLKNLSLSISKLVDFSLNYAFLFLYKSFCGQWSVYQYILYY